MTRKPNRLRLPLSGTPQELLARLLENLERAIRGKKEQLELLLCCVAARGHILLEDVPGTGKTTLAKALALSSGCRFKRVQFTPDLLPSDIVGTAVFNPRDSTFSFKEGPLFANVVIADEINRASPRTQSALLEALNEQQVTVDGRTRSLQSPFLCIATQNPVEFHGTYPLPEAQLDRFSLQISLGYAAEAEERAILKAQHHGTSSLAGLRPVVKAQDIVAIQNAAAQVILEDSVLDYALRLVQATRANPSIRLGVSTRGALHFSRMAQARALMKGRDYVLPEDLRALVVPVLSHRLILDVRARYAGADRRELVAEIARAVPLPR